MIEAEANSEGVGKTAARPPKQVWGLVLIVPSSEVRTGMEIMTDLEIVLKARYPDVEPRLSTSMFYPGQGFDDGALTVSRKVRLQMEKRRADLGLKCNRGEP